MAWVWVFTVFGDRLSSVAISVRVIDPRSRRSTLTWRSVRSSGRVAGSLLVIRHGSLPVIDTPGPVVTPCRVWQREPLRPFADCHFRPYQAYPPTVLLTQIGKFETPGLP